MKKILQGLSPDCGECLTPGELTRISLDDVRDMPTLKMPYRQDVPVVHASSGMRKIIALVYFLVWCLEEHKKAKNLMGEALETKAVMLIDEAESHLHPSWQRKIIPAILSVMNELEPLTEVQFIASTHSPLLMASVEPQFQADIDAWFDIDMVDGRAELTKRQFSRKIRSWLTSDAFDMKSGYSLEAEKALEEAGAALSSESVSKDEFLKIEKRLREVLSDIDPFWIRWAFVAEKKGWRNA